MAEKRTLRTRPSIFRKTDEGVPELEQQASGTSEQQTSQPVYHPGGLVPEPPDVPLSRPTRIKATFYLTADDIVAIDTMQTEAFKRTGKKPERSELVSRAIQVLFHQQGG